MKKISKLLTVLLAIFAATTATAQDARKGEAEAPAVSDELVPGFRVDTETMQETYRKGCEEGNASQCAALAGAYRMGVGGEKREDLARDMYVRACVLDAVAGCNEAGKMATIGKGGERDLVYAIGAFTRGCDAGDKKACVNIAVQKQHGIGLVKNEKVAREAYLLHCKEDEIQASCHNLASMMLNGQGGEKDESGLRLYRANCGEGYKASCAMLKKYADESEAKPTK